MNEAEAVREKLSSLTSAPFKVEQPLSGHRLFGKKELQWFVICPDIAYHRQMGHAQLAWGDTEGNIWLESSILGFATEWVEWTYGEKGAIKAMHMDSPGLANPQFRREFGREFPLVMKRIEDYEKIASQVSSRRKVHIEMSYGKSNVATIALEAKIEAKGMDLQSKLNAIEKNVRALREAYEKIEGLEKTENP